MLFFIGGALCIVAFIMTIRLLIGASQPKVDAEITGIEFKKLKTDIFQMGPEQRHCQVKFNAENGEVESEVAVGKKGTFEVGGTVKVAYKKSDPKILRYWAPSKEILMIVILYLIGGGIMVLSMFLTALLTR